MTAPLLAAYDRPVPRYTSYPTAAQFNAAVGPGEHAAWLHDLGDSSACLYVQVPFCRELCWYCACNTQAMNRPGTLDSYADALVAELEAVARLAPGVVLEGVQWGGGTPSQLGAERLRQVGERPGAPETEEVARHAAGARRGALALHDHARLQAGARALELVGARWTV